MDEGRRLLVSKDPEDRPMMMESRVAEVRRPLMAVKPMTQQRQWVCFCVRRMDIMTTEKRVEQME